VLSGLEVDPVTWTDLFDRSAFALASADPLGDVDRLAERVGVPGGAGARGEVDAGGGRSRRRRRSGDGVDVDVAGEPVAGSGIGIERVAGDLHGLLLWSSVLSQVAGMVSGTRSPAPVVGRMRTGMMRAGARPTPLPSRCGRADGQRPDV